MKSAFLAAAGCLTLGAAQAAAPLALGHITQFELASDFSNRGGIEHAAFWHPKLVHGLRADQVTMRLQELFGKCPQSARPHRNTMKIKQSGAGARILQLLAPSGDVFGVDSVRIAEVAGFVAFNESAAHLEWRC